MALTPSTTGALVTVTPSSSTRIQLRSELPRFRTRASSLPASALTASGWEPTSTMWMARFSAATTTTWPSSR